MSTPPLARIDISSSRSQLLDDHLLSTARRAAAFSRHSLAELAGRWHDLGKYHPDWQLDLHANKHGRDHSTAGAGHAAKHVPGAWGKVLALIIAGHHGGLSDMPKLTQRLQEKALATSEAIAEAPAAILANNVPLPTRQPNDFDVRMLYSALVDADRLDAEAFEMQRERTARHVPMVQLQRRLDAYITKKEAISSPLSSIRREIRIACETAAASASGLFCLTVPTGGGKTLASMAFALRHAQAHGKSRIIVAIPFTSIIEQTAEVYRDVFGGRAVLEHHSAADPDSGHWRQGVDNWEAPVIVTTTVQLFESLHTDRPGRARKLHSLDNAVILIDEAQTLPLNLLPTIHDMMHKLIADYGCTVVLSTASQPLPPRLYNPVTTRLDKWPDPVTEIMPDVYGLEQRLVRVSYDWSRCAEKFSYAKLAGEAALLPAALTITHRRPDAQRLCREIDRLVGDETTLHLSTLMCAAHRSEVLAAVKRQPQCRVVSTQLVEAGVDFSFPVVYKALSGLDSIVQAAGRCNREGSVVLGDVRVFDAETAPPESLRARAEIVRGMLGEGRLGGFVGSKEVTTYFKHLEKKVSLRSGLEIMEARQRLDFPVVAAMFRMIAQTGTPIYVPWGKGVELVARLRKEGPSRELLRRLQRYVIVLHEEDYSSDDVETLHWCEGGAGAGGGEKNCDCPLALSTQAVLERYSYRFGWQLRRDGED